MFNLFKKKAETLEIKEDYITRDFQIDIFTFHQHYNAWLWNIAPHVDYPFLAEIIKYRTLNQNKEEDNKFLDIEALLRRELCKNNLAIHACSTIDNEGTMEFKFYTSDSKKFESIFNRIKLKIKHNKVSFRSHENKSWDVFTDFCPKKK